MDKIFIHIHSDELSAQQLLARLRNPHWYYSNLRQYLGLFTGEEFTKVEHVFEFTSEDEQFRMNMILVWATTAQNVEKLYCISIGEL